MTDARRRQEADKERGDQRQKGLDRLQGLARIKVGGLGGWGRVCLMCGLVTLSAPSAHSVCPYSTCWGLLRPAALQSQLPTAYIY